MKKYNTMKRVSKTMRKPLKGIRQLRIGMSLAWLFILLLLLVVGSCTQTDVEDDVIPPHALKDVDAGFNLNVLATRTPVTRSITFTPDGAIESDTLTVEGKEFVQTKAAVSLTDVQEKQIASLWVGQYDAATGKRLFNQFFSSITGNTVNLKLKQSQNDSHVYFVTNTEDLGEIVNEATLQKHTLAYASTEAGLPENNLCKMMGVWKGMVVADKVNNVTVELTRLLAKITFTYSMGEGFTFTPTSVVLKNAPTVSQVEAPVEQLKTGGISYKTYTGTSDGAGATVYWYLPENMAGTVSGGKAVNSEKQKIGVGVTNATSIELTGDAVQGGVTYKDVTFHFYPGSNMNNYDIIRNAHYTMAVNLVGIDVSDERITVGEIPPIEVDPTEMQAKKGSEKEMQITARPGQQWKFNMPDWLSALLDKEEISPSETVTHQGPATVVFKSIEANPKAESRKASFEIDMNNEKKEITITQSGSSLTKGADISLKAEAASEGSSSFTATEGLEWSAAIVDAAGWLGWSDDNDGTSGKEAPADEQILKVKSKSINPSAKPRRGSIVVKAGASVEDDTYINLIREIAVEQEGSTVTGSTITVNAEGGPSQSSFSATSGLNWALSVADGSWISLTGSTSGHPTTGSDQNVTFNAAVNPSSSQRSNDIVVQAGDTTNGPTGKIAVNQKGAVLTVSGAKAVAETASNNTSTFKATKGLSWSVSDNMDWLTLTSTTSGTNNTTGGNQEIKYSVVVNPNASTRNGNITVKAGNAVSGTDAGLTKTITVTQSASSLTASIYPTTALAATANASGTFTMNGTKDLAYSFTAGFPAWLSVTNGTVFISGGTTNGGYQQLTYRTASVNPNSTERSATVTVKAGNMTKSVIVKQAGSSFSATGGSAIIAANGGKTTGSVIATDGLAWTITPTISNGISISPSNGKGSYTLTFTGSANYGPNRTGSFIVTVDGTTRAIRITATQQEGRPVYLDNIQVCKTEVGTLTWSAANVYCNELNTEGKGDWRLPTLNELQNMKNNKNALNAVVGITPLNAFYWSSDISSSGSHWYLSFGSDGAWDCKDNIGCYVRCVRNK